MPGAALNYQYILMFIGLSGEANAGLPRDRRLVRRSAAL